MRPRLLELTAFGPYAGTVRIDFDDLADDGLFLVHGPTGSGKTSILDGMTYALYGGVAGTRRADRLRSDHADPRTETSVAFEFALHDRDYRITRTPPHERAKKYGSGMTLQKPKASLSVASGDGWEPIATGVEEVGHLITGMLGLDREQFGQVVVLPQGAFASALHADARDRRRLLSSLFRTGRFEHYTAAFVSRAKEAEDAAAQAAAHVQRLRSQALDRWLVIAGATGTGTASADPPHADVEDLAVRGAAAAQEARTDVEVATDIEKATSQALSDARLTAERRRRVAAAHATLEQLEEAAGEVAAARRQVDAAQRAQPLEPLLTAARDVEARAREATGDREAALAALEHSVAVAPPAVADAAGAVVAAAAADPPDVVAVDAARDGVHALVVRLGLAASQHEQSQAAAHSAAQSHRAAADHREQAAGFEAQAQALRSRHQETTQQRDAAEATARRLEVLSDEHARLEQAAAAVTVAAILRKRCAELAETGIVVKERLNAALDRQRRLLEQRIEGMAAELAAGLRADEPCDVCGSRLHPSPAQAGPDAVAAEALEAVGAEVDEARRAVEAWDASQAQVRDELQAAQTLAGGHADDPEALHERRARIDAERADAAAAKEAVAAAEATLANLAAQAQAADGSAGAALQAAAGAEAAAQECLQAAQRLAAEVEAVAGVPGDPAPALRAAHDAATAAGALCAAARAEDDLRREMGAAARRLEEMLARCGFGDPDEATAALMPQQHLQALRASLDDVDRRRMAAQEIVAAEDGLLDDDEPPEDDLRKAHEAAAAALADAQVRLGAVRSAAEDLLRLALDYGVAVDAHGDAAGRARRLRRLADICSGSGNEQRMSLERYVLAAYFEEIAEAASQRLAGMTGGRYTLRHSDARVRGGAASGLSILVHDAYTGTERESGTLSGGETFQASLCLALAVADVVQRHAGGVHLDMLFIDEGFGALDADSLEQAMAELDALREGGRMVGVISHVPALRERINAGIAVTKTATGSDVRVEFLAQA